jgi:hypothetical protein
MIAMRCLLIQRARIVAKTVWNGVFVGFGFPPWKMKKQMSTESSGDWHRL